MRFNGEIMIKETSAEDLDNIMSLWNNGEVMHYVGFPEGLGITLDELKKWLVWVIAKPGRCHYSIYADGIGYCGETFYNVDDEHKTAALDIKLLPEARGKGIAAYSLSYAISRAFDDGNADRAYVDPHPDNVKAWRLYEKLGFISKPRPDYLEEGGTYLEITREEWTKSR
jgi:RimJ/RimL family protein N-acetyltransferase